MPEMQDSLKETIRGMREKRKYTREKALEKQSIKILNRSDVNCW